MPNLKSLPPAPSAPDYSDSPDSPPEAPSTNPLLLLHHLLRGRYRFALALALLLSSLGILVGYHLATPVYRSVGRIEIKPNLRGVMKEGNNILPMFDAYIESQASLLHSQQVLSEALQNPLWQALNRGDSQQALVAFDEATDVSHARNTQLILVTFDDRDPHAAPIAVHAIIDAYLKLYANDEIRADQQTTKVLEDRQDDLTAQLKTLNDKIYAVANEYGSQSLDQIYDFKLQEVNKLETEYRTLQLLLAKASITPPTATAPSQPAAPRVRSPQEIALLDPEMRDLLHKRSDLEQSIRLMKLHLADGHPQLIQARMSLASVNDSITTYAKSYNDGRADGTIVNPNLNQTLNPLAPVNDADLKTLRTRTANIKTLYDQAQKDLVDLGRKNLQIQNLRAEADLVRQHLNETKNRIEQIRIESTVGGRISVLGVERPIKPAADRRTQYAAVAGVGGLLAGFGVFILLGLLDRRYRNIDDACNSLNPVARLLGIVPILPDDLADPEQAAIAAHCVHHIRTLLQLAPSTSNNQDQHVYAITSPCPGDGKTSVSIALGLSFASASSRTLLIDCDIIGAGLSTRMAATIRAKNSQSPRVGLSDYLQGTPLPECVSPTDIPHLFILPVGSAQRQHASNFSPSALRRLIADARPHFDTILCDTGPILGSIEASALATNVDGVILTVSRGQNRPLAERALQHLTSIGAPLAGIVFNRAKSHDILTSKYSMSTNLRSAPPSLDAPPLDRPARTSRLGPLALAVVTSTEDPPPPP